MKHTGSDCICLKVYEAFSGQNLDEFLRADFFYLRLSDFKGTQSLEKVYIAKGCLLAQIYKLWESLTHLGSCNAKTKEKTKSSFKPCFYVHV
jgi:hypothetical protein